MDLARTPTAWALVVWAIVHLAPRAFVRAVLILLGIRRTSPEPGAFMPDPEEGGTGNAGDTGGGGWYRPAWRKQDPSVDPREPGGGESSSRGNDHGWSNCTMASGAMALDFDTQGDRKLWGGDLRHHQGDLEGGTDLYDLRDAWAAYGRDLSIRSGKGWDALKSDRADGRCLVVQGEGNVPGSSTFDGGHACALSPETNADGKWLFGDPLASGWQWVSPSAIRDWMEAWAGSGLAWARSSAHPPPGPPAPTPTPPPAPCYDQADLDAAAAAARAQAIAAAQAEAALERTMAGDELVAGWMGWIRAPASLESDSWGVGAWADVDLIYVSAELVPDPCPPSRPAAYWARGPVPYPVADALEAIRTPGSWGAADWRQATWEAA